jgi:hypothetical protein
LTPLSNGAGAGPGDEAVAEELYRHHGQRVVQGQRMMQAASDIYLGWTKAPDGSRHFYWRQLRDCGRSPNSPGAMIK